MSTAQESCHTQGKYIMCSEWLNNLKAENEMKKEIVELYNVITCMMHIITYFGVLHDSQLGQYRHSFKIYTECPENPVQ